MDCCLLTVVGLLLTIVDYGTFLLIVELDALVEIEKHEELDELIELEDLVEQLE